MNIRLAKAADYPAICDYLEAHWRHGHVFTKSRELFDWQHRTGDDYNFVLGESDGRILGVLGFVPHGQFDPKLGTDALWLCIWSVSEESRGQGLGIRLLSFVEDTYRPRFIGTNGASNMTMPMYAARGWKTGKLEHWYATPETATTGRAGSVRGPYPMPKKTQAFADARYAKHPMYKYDVYGNEHTAVVLRVCEAEGLRMLRVVDLIGSSAGFSHLPWKQLAAKYQATLIDFYCAGIPSRDVEAAGFKRRRGDEVIVPNYFEPYEHRNVDINYAFKAPQQTTWRICKGDGDQDRPNVLP